MNTEGETKAVLNRNATSTNQTEALVVDPSVIIKMVGDNVAIHKKLFDKFINDVPHIIQELYLAYNEKNTSGIESVSHKLKSSSRALGTNQLADLCLSLETAGANGDIDAIDILLPQIIPVVEQIKDYVNTTFN